MHSAAVMHIPALSTLVLTNLRLTRPGLYVFNNFLTPHPEKNLNAGVSYDLKDFVSVNNHFCAELLFPLGGGSSNMCN